MADVNKTIPGTILAVRNMLDGNSALGLVVNEEAGKRWVKNDPTLGYDPFVGGPPSKPFILVRLLGSHLAETQFPSKTALPANEPQRDAVVRWAWAQADQTSRVAGPDAESIRAFAEQIGLCVHLGMTGANFLHDLYLVAAHLGHRIPPPSRQSEYNRLYFEMLAEVVPITERATASA